MCVRPDKVRKISDFFKDHHVELYEIDAENILSQTNKHHDLRFTKIPLSGQDYERQYGRMKTLNQIREMFKRNHP